MIITTTCQNCHKTFSHKKRSRKRKYCSRKCAAIVNNRHHLKNRLRVICPCGKEFSVKPSATYAKHCSIECKNKYGDFPGPKKEWVTISCKLCGTQFNIPPGRIKSIKYCSDCDGRINSGGLPYGPDHPWYRNGKTNQTFGSNWRIQKKRARRRDKNTCRLCGTSKTTINPDVHHIKPRDEYKTLWGLEKYGNALSNLITLCRSCHTSAEHGAISRYKLKQLLRS